MKMPERIGASWLAGLTDTELQQAEWELRATFARFESSEKARRGSRYDLMCGPPSLTNAWMRWSIVANAARARSVQLRYRR